jgi:hypothetical protein
MWPRISLTSTGQPVGDAVDVGRTYLRRIFGRVSTGVIGVSLSEQPSDSGEAESWRRWAVGCRRRMCSSERSEGLMRPETCFPSAELVVGRWASDERIRSSDDWTEWRV